METELIESINRLEVTMSAFTARMLDFKSVVEKRLDDLDSRQNMCQVNPGACSTARKLEEHIKNDSSKSGKVTGIIGCILSCLSAAFLVMGKFYGQ